MIANNTPVKLRLYADDYVLYSSVKNPGDQTVLNTVFSFFRTWSRTWQMVINLEETVSMTFTNTVFPVGIT